MVESKKLAGEEGFEPSLRDPESRVLPLDDSPATLKKRTGIGQKILLLLSNPPNCLDPLCNESISAPVLKYQFGQLWPAGFLFASIRLARVYHIVTDDGNETISRAAVPTQREITRSADETKPKMAPTTLPESVVEVRP